MKIHIAKSGDTLYNLAKKYGVSLDELIAANTDIANPDEIAVGAKIRIPKPGQKTYEIAQEHTVQQGDTMWKLSKAYQVPLADLIAANPQIVNPSALLTGQVIHIPKLPAEGADAGSGMHHHHGGKPDTAAMPAAGEKPNTAVMPAAGEKPSTAVMPTVEAKPNTAPVAPVVEAPPEIVLIEAPAPAPAPAPVTYAPSVQPVQESQAYPVYMTTYEKTSDLFLQIPQPAVEATAQPAYGYGQQAVSPASAHDGGHGYGYGEVQGASAGPASHGYGYAGSSVSPASMGPQGYGYAESAVSPASMSPQGSGYAGTALSPASLNPQGSGYSAPALGPAAVGPQGYGMVNPASTAYGYHPAVSPANIQPYAGGPCVDGIGPLVGGIPAYPGQLGGLEGGIPGHLGGLEGGLPGNLGGLQGGIPGNLGGLQGGIPGYTGQLGGLQGGIPGNLGGLEGGIPGNLGGLQGGIPGYAGQLGGFQGGIPGNLGGLEGGIPGNLGGIGGLPVAPLGWAPSNCHPCAGTPVSPAQAAAYGYPNMVMPVQAAAESPASSYAAGPVSPASVAPANGGGYNYGYAAPVVMGTGAQPYEGAYSQPYRDGFGYVQYPLSNGAGTDNYNRDLIYAGAGAADEAQLADDEAELESESGNAVVGRAKPRVGVAQASKSQSGSKGGASAAKRASSGTGRQVRVASISAPKHRKSLPWMKW